MKSLFRRWVYISLGLYVLIPLLLAACGTTSVTETVNTAQEKDVEQDPTPTTIMKITATPLPATLTMPLPPTITPSLSATPSPHPAPTLISTPSPLSGWLVFESAQEDTNGDGVINRLDDIHIYSLNLNTNELVQLTFGEYRNLHPTWSPDREKIAFVSNQNGNYDLYVMNADGSQIQQLTKTPENETFPVWSPDGQQIIYVLVRALAHGSEERHLYTLSANGENNQRLVFLPGNSSNPDISPDGRFLAFTQTEQFSIEGQNRTGTVVYLHDLQSAQDIRITSPGFETNKGEFERPKWLPREGWYLSMGQVPGDLNPSGMKVFELAWDKEKPLLHQVLDFEEGPGIWTWGPNGEWLISANTRIIFNEDGEPIMTTDISVVPIVIPTLQAHAQLDPAMQESKHVLPGEGNWFTNDNFYEGYLDWSP